MPISIGEWLLTYWDAHLERRSDPDVTKRPLECTACPGDVLFVPHGWWHMVLNIGDDDVVDDRGVSVALTRNYVSASNLSDVLRFLDTRVSQISGCRDRKEAVQPEEFGREFRKALLSVVTENAATEGEGEEKKCDESHCCEDVRKKGKWSNLLEESEKRAIQGWGCDAWVDLPTNNTGGACESNISNGEAHNKVSAGSSILARAKQPPRATDDTLSSSDGAVPSSSAGFSFSFL